jgi:hypothetical protein
MRDMAPAHDTASTSREGSQIQRQLTVDEEAGREEVAAFHHLAHAVDLSSKRATIKGG